MTANIYTALAAVMADAGTTPRRERGKGQHHFPKGTPFWHKVTKPGLSECWTWEGAIGNHGYGVSNGRLAHRLAFEFIVGPIPGLLTVDHLCLNRRCVNPLHMELVTRAENSRRGEPNRRTRSGRPRPDLTSRSACVNGHEFTAENTRIQGNARICLECNRERSRRFRAARRGIRQ